MNRQARDNVGQSLGLPDFVDPADVRDASFEASRTWGEESAAAPLSSPVNRASTAGSERRFEVSGNGWFHEQGVRERQVNDDEPDERAGKTSRRTTHSTGRGSTSGFGTQRRSKGSSKKRQLTWAEKAERKERRADKRAEADAKERERDPLGHAREIVLTQLTAAPKSRAQLERKLAERDVDPDVAEAVLDRMEDVGLVNDAELAGMIVRSQVAGRGLARRALRQELQKKGIAGQEADLALEQVSDDDERQRARELVDKKLRTMSRLDEQTKKRRLIGLLGRKGYSGSLAWSVINEALGDAEFAHTDDDFASADAAFED